MSLIQSYKLGPSSGTPGSAQRLVERLSPAVRRAVEGVFDPVVDRVVLEDRALMELLAKVPEEQVREKEEKTHMCDGKIRSCLWSRLAILFATSYYFYFEVCIRGSS